MKLQSLKLYDFRNYAAAGVQLHPGVNLIVGENAQGKTNLLEAVFYLSTGRSFGWASVKKSLVSMEAVSIVASGRADLSDRKSVV